MDEQWDLVIRQIAVLKERFVYGEVVDPVFEGVVRDFALFDQTINSLYTESLGFLRQVEQLSGSLLQTSESVVKHLAQSPDPLIISDSLKYREAAQQIAYSDAPHSALAKLRRDLEYNLSIPLRAHVVNNRQVRHLLGERKNKLLEVTAAQKLLVEAEKAGNQRKALAASQEFEVRRREFEEIDRNTFDWLCILEEYKDDISDSTLQTLKYLQYEFFATAAHAVAKILPPRMEFRPMVEMTPKHLETQIDLEREEEAIAGDGQESSLGAAGQNRTSIGDYSTRIVERMEKARLARSAVEDEANVMTNVPVDPLSLSVLLSHGFDEGAARKALRTHANDTQAALEFLLNPPAITAANAHHAPTLAPLAPNPAKLAVRVATDDGEATVRMPATLARIQRLKEVKKKIGERNALKEKRREERTGERLTTLADDQHLSQESVLAAAAPTGPSAQVNLIDFEENKTVPLPEKRSLIDDDFWK